MAESCPLVSIGMPVYNGDRFICHALDSLLAQDYGNFELIILDNASTDATGVICHDYAGRDARIRYYRHATTIPYVDNFNRVLGLASGDYFMWAAHDDLWEPSFISSLVTALGSEGRYVLACSGFDTVDYNNRRRPCRAIDWGRLFQRPKFWQFAGMLLLDESSSLKATHLYGLMRREALLACGGMAVLPLEYSGEDVISLLRLLGHGDIVVISRVLFHYRVRQYPTRGKQGVLRYLWRRFSGSVPGHRANVVTFLRRIHVFHSSMRRVIVQESPLGIAEKIVLCLALTFKEVWQVLGAVPRAGLKQLRGG